MDRLLYIAMTGAHQTMLSQAVNTNNLANATTVGFRADLEAATAMPMNGPVHGSRVYGMVEGQGVDLRPGDIHRTGRALDIAIKGEGWIAVQAADGGEAYTRAGDLRINSVGILTTGNGHPVLGEGGPIAIPPHQSLDIGADGTITIRPLGDKVNALAVLDRIKLVKLPSDQVVKGRDGLVRSKNGAPVPADGSVTIVSGALEMSNVKAVESMVRLIELARQYETQVKMMKTAEDNDRAAEQILRMG